MTFEEILAQVQEQLQREGRVAYRILKRRFNLSDDDLEDLKADLIDAKRLAVDEEGKVLVWTGASPVQSSTFQVPSLPQSPIPNPQSLAERRQLTVMFCDLVGSTALSEQLDPEDLREVVRAYQETCTTVLRRYDGHIAQHLGDGLLVYFGYPTAHEDDAARAVRAGLEIISALQSAEGSNPRLPSNAAERQVKVGRSFKAGLRVRIGLHTGLVVVGEIGSGDKREILALGETPNIAARVQGIAEPDTVVISAATHRLVQGLFEYQDLGTQTLKGVSIPLSMYRVVKESAAQSRFEVAVGRGLTPLVGREEELGLLQRRWEQAKDGAGQVVLLSGEPGIGKSRLVQTLKEQIMAEGAHRIEFHCSAYHQNSAFYPLIGHLQRALGFERGDSAEEKLRKLEMGAWRAVPLQPDTISLLAALLSLPHPEGAPPLTLSPQKQKQKTQETLVAWIIEEAEHSAMFCAWEDLHWADPSTLEVLTHFLEQIPTIRMFSMLTCRPEFTPPWGSRSYITLLTLSRLGRRQVEAMAEQVTGGKTLPSEVVQQIVVKTDGVPLFVEELTKTVLESGLLREEDGRYVGAHGGAPIPPLAIPATLQDSLMARLDRLSTVRELAQVGAVLGREFSYELLHAISPLDEELLQQGLQQLVEAELIYQRGLPPQATYLFKHALIQDTAYQSLLKSRRQQLHQQVAQVLLERFPETVETQPELLAHHYTEASLIEQAIPYWQQAGQRAVQRSANVEAIHHLTKGLELLKMLPNTPERVQQELMLQITLSNPLATTKGFAAPEVENVYARARQLCQQVGETLQLLPVLVGLGFFYEVRGEFQIARELEEQLLRLAQRAQDPVFLLWSHYSLGDILFWMGESVLALEHQEQAMTLYDPQQALSSSQFYGGFDPRVACRSIAGLVLWHLGYPEQALKRINESLSLARDLSHPFSLAIALNFALWFQKHCREWQTVQEWTETAITLSTEQGYPLYLASGIILWGRVLAEQGKGEEGITQIRQGLGAWRATGAGAPLSYFLTLLAEACERAGQTEEGLTTVAEALAIVDKTGERRYEAELYRLKGELLLAQARKLEIEPSGD